MSQKQYVEKPTKVLAEQFFAASVPPAVGVCVCGLAPNAPAKPPHVHLDGGVVYLAETDWILAHLHTNQIEEVITNVEFEDRFGNQPAA